MRVRDIMPIELSTVEAVSTGMGGRSVTIALGGGQDLTVRFNDSATGNALVDDWQVYVGDADRYFNDKVRPEGFEESMAQEALDHMAGGVSRDQAVRMVSLRVYQHLMGTSGNKAFASAGALAAQRAAAVGTQSTIAP